MVLEGTIGVSADFGAAPENGVVVAVVGGTIAWNATNALYELLGFFFCGVLVIVLVKRRFGHVAVLGFDAKVIFPGVIVVVVVVVRCVRNYLEYNKCFV